MDSRIEVYNEKMQKAYDYLLADYQTIRAGRANPHVLDKIKVNYYGTPTPIQQVGNISVPEARMIQTDRSLGEVSYQRDRKGYTCFRCRHHSFKRRSCYQTGIPRAYRGQT